MDNAAQDFLRYRGRLEISGSLTLVTPLRIGAGSHDDMNLADITVIKDALGRPFIPGSSFKGVLRSYVESIMRTIDPDGERNLACLCVTFEENGRCPTTMRPERLQARVNALKAEAGRPNDPDDSPYLDKIYLEDTCRVCRVFGSTGLASKLIVPDLPLKDAWYGRYQIRHGVSIDRDTETAADGLLYTNEVVPAGTRFSCNIQIENGTDADQGLVLLGLRAFEQGLVTLGGSSSRGLGQVKLTIESCQEVKDNATDLIEFLVSGQSQPVAENDRLAKIQALREELGV